MAIIIEEVPNQKGLAFVMHGLGGFKEQPHIETFANAFREKGYTAIRFDTTNTFGESDGDYEKATTTNYFEDLEDVIDWAESQKWFQKPFVLAGHSLGAFCSAFYAEKYPGKVKALAPISTVVSGQLSTEREDMKKWQETRWRISESTSKPGIIKKLPWSHMGDRLKHDLLPKAENLTMPILMIVGENDTSTFPKHQQILFEKLSGKKELHIIKGAEHTFREKEHLDEIKKIFLKWIAKI